MRNAGKRDRRRERAITSVGKHYPFPHSQPDPESFAVSFFNCVGNTSSFTDADLRISGFQPRRNGISWFHACTGDFTRGIPKSSPQTEAVNATSL